MRLSTFSFYKTNTLNITRQQSNVNESIIHLSSGKRVITAGDDAVATHSILNFRQEVVVTEQYQRNVDFANSRIGAEESSLSSTEDVLFRVKDLMLQGNSGALDATSRGAIADELEERFDQLLALANTRDEGGNFVFAGYQTDIKPFLKTPDGTVVYRGDNGQRENTVGPGVSVPTSDSGQKIFQEIPNALGDFKVDYRNDPADPELITNTGGVVVERAAIADRSVYDPITFPPPYTANFIDSDPLDEVTDPEIEVLDSLGNQLDVFDSSGNQVSPPPLPPALPTPFVSGETYTFNGVELAIEGIPNVGDSLVLNEQSEVDLFDVLRQAIDWMRAPDVDDTNSLEVYRGQRGIDIGHLIDDIDQAQIHISAIRGEIGSRLNTVETFENVNEEYILTVKTANSELEDLDYAEAITEFERQKVALQAAQSSFTQVQDLTLFNYI
jgi:flagellar hook-associated protein 3 FlgL